MSNSSENAKALANAWRASNPENPVIFVLVRNGSASAAHSENATELGAEEDLGTQIVDKHGHVWTVRSLDDMECPLCHGRQPEKASFDEWNFFNCVDDYCGARLLLDEAGQPRGYEGEFTLDDDRTATKRGGRPSVTIDRNHQTELTRDIEFLDELASDLRHGRGEDEARLDSLADKLKDWKDALEELLR